MTGISIAGASMGRGSVGTLVTASIVDPAVNAAVSAEIIDAYGGVIITTTKESNTQTLQSPTPVATEKTFLVLNNDSSTNTILINGITLSPGEARSFFWDGTGWLTAADASLYALLAGNPRFTAGLTVGSPDNHMAVSSGGVVTLTGTAKRTLMLRPGIDVITQIAKAKPTQYTRGAHKGFSMPIWDSGGNADEQLYLFSIVPLRWDGISDLKICAATQLTANEDIGKKFKFQLLWDCLQSPGVVRNDTVVAEVETTVLSGRTAAYNLYRLDFVIDYNTINHVITQGCLLSWILRRVGASENEVANEIVIYVSAPTHNVDKMYGDS